MAGGGGRADRGADSSRGEHANVRGAGVRGRVGGTGGEREPGRDERPGRPAEGWDLPATTRIGGRGGGGRGIQLAIAAVVVALLLAVAKPWDWIAPPASPGPVAGVPGATAGPASSGIPRPTADPMARAGCLIDPIWTAVVDQVVGRTSSRSWTRLDLVPASGPTDPVITTITVYADTVPRIGFCVPAAAPGATAVPTPDAAAATAALAVQVWRVTLSRTGAPQAAVIRPEVLSGGTIGDRGAMLGAPRPATGARLGTTPLPWPPGRYVFRVELAGAGPGGTDAAWFAFDLRGPWTGPPDAAAPLPWIPGAPMGAP